MASHRKPKRPRPYTLTGSTARTAATLALAGAATGTALEGTGHAAPQPTPAQVKTQVDRYYQEAEAAAERYNGAREKERAAQDSLDELRDEAARKTERLNAARNALGAYATAQYREGGLSPAVRLALSASPEQYLDRASRADHMAGRQTAALKRVERELEGVRQVRTAADAELARLKESQSELAAHKRSAEAKLDAAKRLLKELPPKKTTDTQNEDSSANTTRDTALQAASRSATRAASGNGTTQAPTERAARAVSFAYSALGKPYVWGATGPSAYDCSGLTQAAWRAAGVSLPRTTYTQINAGSKVARSQLAPGDLVFFYSGVSHVGIYVGDGKMIHAPRPGAPVRVAPIDQMPFAGATRPA
ncbi:C40 family peptidase [Streptomyces varsoviensis]|uniref:C40 family peptidase n=1 Tax=Streptomyces varsoviensis TaxID=67373 RepID=UPI0004C7ED1C|nr:C40 family peptidase [Streptomyces varsoviensis]